ncbi:rRNA maturation RNase YbeY [Psychromonas antarctica]|jgi:probable rRNA maturation factor|uniref:rRNA maturation RNase YbeY n=1 Tax=Psychromonas antarctica TaxID=67573 RepID=UPI001EE8438E|nr:rRNA maturation RNase YbeY [Psychromonas antarctica]MCG6199754.1 rRNA maturation RNase YbeY [Psychromonas antarctica]
MDLFVDLQIASANEDALPELSAIEEWIHAAIIAGSETTPKEAELTVRIVDSAESQQLNFQYRHTDKATNVLSFPFQNPPGITLPLLGDLVICKQVVENEAKTQGKPLTAHWAHMLIHGTLHLLGYDHISDQEANEMETLETKLLIELGFADPYLSEKE